MKFISKFTIQYKYLKKVSFITIEKSLPKMVLATVVLADYTDIFRTRKYRCQIHVILWYMGIAHNGLSTQKVKGLGPHISGLYVDL